MLSLPQRFRKIKTVGQRQKEIEQLLSGQELRLYSFHHTPQSWKKYQNRIYLKRIRTLEQLTHLNALIDNPSLKPHPFAAELLKNNTLSTTEKLEKIKSLQSRLQKRLHDITHDEELINLYAEQHLLKTSPPKSHLVYKNYQHGDILKAKSYRTFSGKYWYQRLSFLMETDYSISPSEQKCHDALKEHSIQELEKEILLKNIKNYHKTISDKVVFKDIITGHSWRAFSAALIFFSTISFAASGLLATAAAATPITSLATFAGSFAFSTLSIASCALGVTLSLSCAGCLGMGLLYSQKSGTEKQDPDPTFKLKNRVVIMASGLTITRALAMTVGTLLKLASIGVDVLSTVPIIGAAFNAIIW